MMEEEGMVIVGLLVGLNVLDANLCLKGEDLDSQVKGDLDPDGMTSLGQGFHVGSVDSAQSQAGTKGCAGVEREAAGEGERASLGRGTQKAPGLVSRQQLSVAGTQDAPREVKVEAGLRCWATVPCQRLYHCPLSFETFSEIFKPYNEVIRSEFENDLSSNIQAMRQKWPRTDAAKTELPSLQAPGGWMGSGEIVRRDLGSQVSKTGHKK